MCNLPISHHQKDIDRINGNHNISNAQCELHIQCNFRYKYRRIVKYRIKIMYSIKDEENHSKWSLSTRYWKILLFYIKII